MEKSKQLKLFPNEKGTIGQIFIGEEEGFFENKITKSKNIAKNLIETIVILDVSGSMGSEVDKICSRILPNFFDKLDYHPEEKIYFVMFESTSVVIHDSIKNIFSNNYTCLGGTNFTPALKKLEKILEDCKKKNIRILTISDGGMDDNPQAVEFSSILMSNFKGKFNINSQAIRYFTSLNQPDTRGLSSILQLSTNITSLIDVSGSLPDEEIINKFVNMFENDKFGVQLSLISEYNIFKTSPFSQPENSIQLTVGDNIFWISEDLFIDQDAKKEFLDKYKIYFSKIVSNEEKEESKESVTICFGEISLKNYYNIFENKFIYFLQRLKLLKIVNSKESIEEIMKTVKYFEQLEQSLEGEEIKEEQMKECKENINLRNSLVQRAEELKKLVIKREKSLSVILSQIANDDKVNKLNSAQQADYLRNLQVDKNTKGLARRALSTGIDFDGSARSEVIEMHKHLKEIFNIDDSDHTISFYSNCTTLEGIKMVCALVDDESIYSFSCIDILKLINIVGIACESNIGDYPDPMTWRVNKLYAGCYTSISDILTVCGLSSGKENLKDISSGNDIHNVIPFFEDERIHKFLKKYAPNILEYTSSIGMRRIVANVSQTYNYTLVSGCWKMVEILDKNKSDINVRTFISLVKTYEYSIGNYFNHVLDVIKEPENDRLSFYIANNGISNMFSVLIKITKNGITKYFDRILRALYAFETYQIGRKLLKDIENPNDSAREKLISLLGIDFDKFGTKLPELFAEEEKPKFHKEYHINFEMLDNFIKSTWFIDYVSLLPEYLAAVYSENPIENLKKVPQMDEKYILKALQVDKFDKKINLLTDSDKSDTSINIDHLEFASDTDGNTPLQNENVNKISVLKKFKFYNFIQAMLYNSKAFRVNDEKQEMKIKDLIFMRKFEKEIRKFIYTCYKDKYEADLRTQLKNETQILCDMLVEQMKEADIDSFKRLAVNGITKGRLSLSLNNSTKLGYMNLINGLSNPKNEFKFRFEKIEIIIYGYDPKRKDDAEGPIFNNGACIRRDHLKIFKNVYDFFNKDFCEIFNKISVGIHIYRNLRNRHGHCNENPSYWALGFDSVLEMKYTVSKEKWDEYKELHLDCCGMKNLNFNTNKDC